MSWHVVDNWSRNNLLPTVLLILGAALIGRIVRWLGARYREAIDRGVKTQIEEGGVIPEGAKRGRAVGQAAEWVVLALIYVVATILSASEIGIPLTSLVAPATVIGVALGFGAQQMVGDLLAGFFLFAERQFGVGDQVRLSLPGQLTGISGTVEELTLRVTKLRTAQGEVIVVPNSALRQVSNLSKDWSRVVLDVPIPVEEDLERVSKLIDDVASTMADEPAWRDQILGKPIMAGVETIEVGYVQLRLLVRTLPGKQFDIGRELRLRILLAFREQGIKIPLPPANVGDSI
ncbi:MAG: mechanosensitive ion channel family protein [Acidimicrobiaceae bacterium]|nr:mechanosensitive ion channel family protein [Acidimicrobiaceae bacterium]